MISLKVVYIAYSCLPNKGSEEKIGWNIPMESAKTNEVIVVTKEEHRPVIEKYVTEHQINNPRFYFVDIPKFHKKIWKGSAYSIRLNIWHKRAFPVVKALCEREGVEIVHQVTPIEFRSVGPYHKIPNTRFVCGPMGGGEYIPAGLRKYTLSNLHIELSRWLLNSLYKLKYRAAGQLAKCDYFLFANYETQHYLCALTDTVPGEVYFDNGISDDDFCDDKKKRPKARDKFVFLIAGRMAYRKGHRFLLDAIRQLPKDTNCQFRFVGTGPELKKLKRICQRNALENRIVFTGRLSFAEMAGEYEKADAFIMPSIRETTGAVLLEAASKGVPVITINRFGGPVLFDDQSAYFYMGNNKATYLKGLERAIMSCIEDPETLSRKAREASKNAQSHTWERKVIKYNEIYQDLLKSRLVRHKEGQEMMYG